jgi:hypothetical protein
MFFNREDIEWFKPIELRLLARVCSLRAPFLVAWRFSSGRPSTHPPASIATIW